MTPTQGRRSTDLLLRVLQGQLEAVAHGPRNLSVEEVMDSISKHFRPVLEQELTLFSRAGWYDGITAAAEAFGSPADCPACRDEGSRPHERLRAKLTLVKRLKAPY